MMRAGLIWLLLSAPLSASPIAEHAIASFNAVCFKAGQTKADAHARMQSRDGNPLPYELTFWDKTLEQADGVPTFIERRCEVRFEGLHGAQSISALRKQMATPPVFGFEIPLPETHTANNKTKLLEGRELLRGRVAVVEVSQTSTDTLMRVDRLPADWQEMLP